MHTHATRNRAPQRGTTLFEALIAFLVLSLGMLAMARVQGHSRLHADVSRQQSEALRLAQEDIESMRAFAVLGASAGVRSYDDVASDARTIDAASGFATTTRYRLTRQVAVAAQPSAKDAAVTVAWTDRAGQPHQLVLDTLIAGVDPALVAALGLARPVARTRAVHGRAAQVPLTAKDLGNGRSAYKPADDAAIAYLFDNAAGRIVGRCSGVDPALATRDLTSAVLVNCDARAGLWLAGSVRFSTVSPPDPAAANDAPPAVAVYLALSGAGYAAAPECSAQARKTVRFVAAGRQHTDDVPLAATAAALGLPGWIETGERHVAYGCVVYPTASGQWSGRATLVPVGWTLGSAATDRRVCRYSADLDASGAIDANIEHPADYIGVGAALVNQDFLVINGNETCPAAPAVQLTGGVTDVFADLSTAPHQP